MPLDSSYPKNKKGDPLYLIAQLNFAEMPQIKDFPEKGILQFYVEKGNSWGMEYPFGEANYDGYCVLFFENPDNFTDDQLVKDFSFLKPLKKHDLPIKAEFGILFKKKQMAMGFSDYRFEKLFKDFPIEEVNYDSKIIDKLTGFSSHSEGSRVGGYPTFTQYDPRADSKDNFDEYELLFQMDSMYLSNQELIMWGDLGVANFFIKTEDLGKRDFSKVLYYWDCG